MQNVTITIGRLIFGITFGIWGIIHLMRGPGMSMMVPEFMPGDGTFWVYFSGICLIASSISIVSGRMIGLSCSLLATLLILFVLTIHVPNMMNEETLTFGLTGLLKDTALAGAALVFAGMFGEEDVEEAKHKVEVKKQTKEVEVERI